MVNGSRNAPVFIYTTLFIYGFESKDCYRSNIQVMLFIKYNVKGFSNAKARRG